MTIPRTKPKKRAAKAQAKARDSEAAEVSTFDKKLGDWLDKDEQWKLDAAAASYDGILGSLPNWIPHGINNEFVRLRNNLLGSSVCGEKITHEIALLYLDRYKKLGEGDEKESYIPSEVFEVVGQLARWRYIVSLGQQKG